MSLFVLLQSAAVNCPQQYLKMLDVRPQNEHVSYPGDQPWHVPFTSPPLTPNHDPTSSGSEAKSNDPLDEISAASSTTSNICLRQQIGGRVNVKFMAKLWETWPTS